MVLLRLELGVISRGCVGPVEMVCEHLRLGDIDKVCIGTHFSYIPILSLVKLVTVNRI